jgi:cytochrome P450
MNPTRRFTGPPGLPLLGHLPKYRRHRLNFLVRCAADYGDVVKLHIGTPTLLLTNPDDIKHVLITHPERYAKTLRISGMHGQQALGKGLLTSLGTEHLKQRRAMQPLFHPRAIEAFTGLIVSETQAWSQDWGEGEAINIVREIRELAQAIMIKTLFGSDYVDEGGTLAKAINVRRRYYEHILGALLPLPQYQPARILLEYRKAIKLIDAVLNQALQTRRASHQHSGDMLSGLMHIRYEDGITQSDSQIRTEALTFMDTGYETISAALTWTWYLLAQHPEIESTLAAELKCVLNRRLPVTGDAQKLPYTEMVLMESMRLYPPTWNFVRTVLKEDTLPCGATVKPGSKLFLCQYIVHHNPRYYPDPERFDPQRFSSKPDKDRPRYTYFPFGGGAHICLGETFAELECILVLATLAQRFKFVLEPDQTVELKAGLALRPQNAIWMRVYAK